MRYANIQVDDVLKNSRNTHPSACYEFSERNLTAMLMFATTYIYEADRIIITILIKRFILNTCFDVCLLVKSMFGAS